MSSTTTKLYQLVLFTYLTFICSATPVPEPVPSTTTALPEAETSTTYDQTSDYGGSAGGNAIDTDAGASGTDHGSFQLSHGAIVAIAVVVSLVVVVGIVTTILFFIARKRQWQVRKTIRRASRRVASRITGNPTKEQQIRKGRRHGAVRLQEDRNGRNVERDLRKGVNAKAIEMTKSKRPGAVAPSS